MSSSRLSLLAPVLALVLWTPSPAASSSECPVPSPAHPTIQSALDDPACSVVEVAAGVFTEDLSITRSVALAGAGAQETIITGSGALPVVALADATPRALVVRDLTITGGGSSFGGGLHIVGAAHTVTIERVRVWNNHVFNLGGGLNIQQNATVTIVDSAIHDNRSDDFGGGINVGSGTLGVTNTTISGNRADGFGGGISAGTSTLIVLTHATIAGNVADADGDTTGSGGGGYFAEDVQARNTIIAGNSTPECLLTGPPIASNGHNIGGDASCLAPPDRINTDPQLGPLADNGGPTPTRALLPGSPAIDAADPLTATATDQRGLPRSPDIGAYELAFCRGVVVNRVGTPGTDTLLGTGGSDGVLAFGGDDVVATGAGDDAVCAGTGNDTIDAGPGDDTVLGGEDNDTLTGGAGNDRLSGQQGTDTLVGEAGKDRLLGGPGKDTQKGGAGNDKLVGHGGGDRQRGQVGRDRLRGGGGPDRQAGGPGNDRIAGQGGNDRINGGPGTKDRCRPGAGRDRPLKRCER